LRPQPSIAAFPARELGVVVSREERKIASLEVQQDSLTLLREAARAVLSREKVQSLPAREVAKVVSQMCRRSTVLSEAVREQEAKMRRLRARGFTEEELTDLLQKLQQGGRARSRAPGAKALESRLAAEVQRTSSLKTRIGASGDRLRNIDAELGKAVGRALGGSSAKDQFAEARRRSLLIKDVLQLVRDNHKNVIIGEEDDLAEVATRLEHYSVYMAQVRKEFERIEEKGAMEARWTVSLSQVRKRLSQLEASHSRAQRGLQVLNDLLKSDSKEGYLGQVLAQQNRKLVDIFCRIHSPSEFKKVSIDGDVRLTRDKGGETDLSGISTGQRSALAVSIFLSMNSSVGMRAPWIIFDDPVAQVDDLNTLSFLDALREFVLAGERQLFFATANSRIASIVTRKFDFLGTDFKDIPLSRA
jgi:exonuclease SbcC